MGGRWPSGFKRQSDNTRGSHPGKDMSHLSNEVWQFVVEWYDPLPQMKKKYILKYFVEKHMVEMIDIKNKKVRVL